MNGFDKPSLYYSIYSFTGQGFGGKIQIDFAQNAEDEVTLARFDPTGTRMLVKTGKVLRTEYRVLQPVLLSADGRCPRLPA